MALSRPGRMAAIFWSSASFTGVVKSWQFMSFFAQWATASEILGWECPREVT